jgi:GDPmannose 4,6-dehydratase
MATALIFGVNGQDGHYLRELLTKKHVETIGISRSEGEWVRGNVSDGSFVEKIIKEVRPAYIFHLAATSSIHHELLQEHQSTILQGSLNILESALKFSQNSRVFIAGSGLQFINNGTAISEQSEFLARDAYSLARIQSVYAARYYRSKGLATYTGYLFHHDSPYRTHKHLNRRIADAARSFDIANNKIEIGDLSVEKEFGFAGDIAEGILTLVNQEAISEACIGTGKAYPIHKWLELCFSIAGKDWEEMVVPLPGYTADFKRLVSDPSLMMSTGWSPKIEVEELARMMMNA